MSPHKALGVAGLLVGLAVGCGTNSGNGDSVATNAVHPSPSVSAVCTGESSQGVTTDCNAAVPPPSATPSEAPTPRLASTAAGCGGKRHGHHDRLCHHPHRR
jgi:hypothetical protein